MTSSHTLKSGSFQRETTDLLELINEIGKRLSAHPQIVGLRIEITTQTGTMLKYETRLDPEYCDKIHAFNDEISSWDDEDDIEGDD